jgi:hypothetical protein
MIAPGIPTFEQCEKTVALCRQTEQNAKKIINEKNKKTTLR